MQTCTQRCTVHTSSIGSTTCCNRKNAKRWRDFEWFHGPPGQMVYFAFLFIQNDQKQTNGNAAAAAAHSSILDAATIQFNMCVSIECELYKSTHCQKKKNKKKLIEILRVARAAVRARFCLFGSNCITFAFQHSLYNEKIVWIDVLTARWLFFMLFVSLPFFVWPFVGSVINAL